LGRRGQPLQVARHELPSSIPLPPDIQEGVSSRRLPPVDRPFQIQPQIDDRRVVIKTDARLLEAEDAAFVLRADLQSILDPSGFGRVAIQQRDVPLTLRVISAAFVGLLLLRLLGDPPLQARWAEVPELLSAILLDGLTPREGS
jgi:hypothetical protein